MAYLLLGLITVVRCAGTQDLLKELTNAVRMTRAASARNEATARAGVTFSSLSRRARRSGRSAIFAGNSETLRLWIKRRRSSTVRRKS